MAPCVSMYFSSSMFQIKTCQVVPLLAHFIQGFINVKSKIIILRTEFVVQLSCWDLDQMIAPHLWQFWFYFLSKNGPKSGQPDKSHLEHILWKSKRLQTKQASKTFSRKVTLTKDSLQHSRTYKYMQFNANTKSSQCLTKYESKANVMPAQCWCNAIVMQRNVSKIPVYTQSKCIVATILT